MNLHSLNALQSSGEDFEAVPDLFFRRVADLDDIVTRDFGHAVETKMTQHVLFQLAEHRREAHLTLWREVVLITKQQQRVCRVWLATADMVINSIRRSSRLLAFAARERLVKEHGNALKKRRQHSCTRLRTVAS